MIEPFKAWWRTKVFSPKNIFSDDFTLIYKLLFANLRRNHKEKLSEPYNRNEDNKTLVNNTSSQKNYA